VYRCNSDACVGQRKTEDAETVDGGADEAKKAKPSEETNGAGDADGDAADTDEQPPVRSGNLLPVWHVGIWQCRSLSVCLSVPIAVRLSELFCAVMCVTAVHSDNAHTS